MGPGGKKTTARFAVGAICDLARQMDWRPRGRSCFLSAYLAIEQMAWGLWWLGLELAHKHRVGMPFDVMLVRYNVGRDEASTLAIIERHVLEARKRVTTHFTRGQHGKR